MCIRDSTHTESTFVSPRKSYVFSRCEQRQKASWLFYFFARTFIHLVGKRGKTEYRGGGGGGGVFHIKKNTTVVEGEEVQITNSERGEGESVITQSNK